MSEIKKHKIYPPEIRAFAVEWMLANTAEAPLVQIAIADKFNTIVSVDTLYTWRRRAGIEAPKIIRGQKPRQLTVVEREELEEMRRFNRMIGLMKPIGAVSDCNV